MIKQFEAINNYDGKTTVRISYDNPCQLANDCNTTLDEATDHTIGSVLRYAGHIWTSLVWVPTDNGLRTTVRFGHFTVFLYQ